MSTASASMFDLPRAATGDQPIERHLLDSAAVAAAAATLAAVGDGAPGKYTRQFRTHLLDIQYGRVEDTHGWMHRVL
uniref:Uncharacterized protein n=1 Tax=Micromonospora carbonacea TaxID=47853 RepID=A0A7D5Y9C3_9ACTN|nr:hypothetical protein HZU44_27440 [Micromonospora carbonacea]